MAKVTVILNCQIDNGKDKKLPGETVSMDEKEAAKLAEKGLVKFPTKEVQTEKAVKAAAKAAGKSGKEAAPSGAETGDDLDPDTLDQGGESDDENGEGR